MEVHDGRENTGNVVMEAEAGGAGRGQIYGGMGGGAFVENG